MTPAGYLMIGQPSYGNGGEMSGRIPHDGPRYLTRVGQPRRAMGGGMKPFPITNGMTIGVGGPGAVCGVGGLQPVLGVGNGFDDWFSGGGMDSITSGGGSSFWDIPILGDFAGGLLGHQGSDGFFGGLGQVGAKLGGAWAISELFGGGAGASSGSTVPKVNPSGTGTAVGTAAGATVTPSWVTPALVGGGILLLAVVLLKRK